MPAPGAGKPESAGQAKWGGWSSNPRPADYEKRGGDTSVPDDQKAPEYWRDPLVASTTPSDGSSVAAPSAVTVTFARDITPAGSDYSGSVTVTDDGTAVTGTTATTASGVLTWTPSTALTAGTYEVAVTNVASANAGCNLPIQEPYQFSFTVS